MTDNTFAFGSTVSVTTEGIQVGPTVSAGIVVEPNGQISTFLSIGLTAGLGVSTPVEFGIAAYVIAPGQSLFGYGGTVPAQFISQTGIAYSNAPGNDSHVTGAFGGFASAISISASFGYTFQPSIIAPPFNSPPLTTTVFQPQAYKLPAIRQLSWEKAPPPALY
jgi:hypothetical protein